MSEWSFVNRREAAQSWWKAQVRRALPDWLALCALYRRMHGVFPNLVRPTTFTEKVLFRAAFDRRPLLAQISDKAGARDYVTERLGAAVLSTLYHATTRPETIPFDTFPEKFVVKATHGSGWVEIVRDKGTFDRAALVRRCEGWLQQSYYELGRERIYKNVQPKIHVEEFVDDGSPDTPNDYKIFVFDGTARLIQVNTNRFVDIRENFYSPDWTLVDLRIGRDAIAGRLPPPPHLAEMVTAAEFLGLGIDFLRVDCFDTPARFYVTELTATPGRGMHPFHPIEFDRYLGEQWELSTPLRLCVPGMV
jgi:hypothetical protein